MSEANERGLSLSNNIDLISKLWEIVESLTRLNKLTMEMLAQYQNVEEYEADLSRILGGDDVIID